MIKQTDCFSRNTCQTPLALILLQDVRVCVCVCKHLGLNTQIQFTFFGPSILLKWRRARMCLTRLEAEVAFTTQSQKDHAGPTL